MVGHHAALCNLFGHTPQAFSVTAVDTIGQPLLEYVATMVTRIRHKQPRRRLFLREHRKAKGVSAETMAGRLDIERESVLRLEREPWRVNSEKQAEYASALGVEPEALWRPPGVPSLDELVAGASKDVQDMALDIVSRLVKRAG